MGESCGGKHAAKQNNDGTGSIEFTLVCFHIIRLCLINCISSVPHILLSFNKIVITNLFMSIYENNIDVL